MATTETTEPVVELTAAARQLGLSYWAARDALLRGEVVGHKNRDGRWVVRTDSLQQFAARREER